MVTVAIYTIIAVVPMIHPYKYVMCYAIYKMSYSCIKTAIQKISWCISVHSICRTVSN